MYSRIIFDYDNKIKLLKNIKIELSSHINVSKDLNKIQILNQRYISIEVIINLIDQIFINLTDLNELIEVTTNDDLLINEIDTQLIHVKCMLSQLETYQMFNKNDDNCSCYIDIQSGSGGRDAQDWANMLLRMYLRWINSKGFNSEIIEESSGECSGIKSVTVKVIGLYAYGWLRTESGVHRLVRKSPFDSSGKRHTSFASIFVYPELDNSIDICIKPEDLRFDFYRSSGAGGQHVNCTESAVRVTHIPTNIVTQCQSDRSQHKNKNQAIKQLKSKLYNFELKKKQVESQISKNKKRNITWGNQIRSYILDNSRVKDLRTGLEKRNIKAVLNGDLDDFIKTSIKNLN